MNDAETLRFDGLDPIEGAAGEIARYLSKETSMKKCLEMFRFYTSGMAETKRQEVIQVLKDRYYINLEVKRCGKDQTGQLF